MRVKSACPLDCWDTCSMWVEVDQGRIVNIEGDPKHPITQGFLCARGRRLAERRESPHRLLFPLKRTSQGWQRISWRQAITEIAAEVQKAIAEYGHHSILHVYDWGSGTLLKSLNQRFFYLLGGCTETVGSLCWEAGLEAQRYDFGLALSHAPEDLVHARTIVFWGRNVANTNIHMTPFLKRALRQGSRLVIVNPLPTDLDARAALRIAPRPGTDAALALAALRIARDRGWLDQVFLTAHSVGWEELSASLDRYSLEWAAAETDVSPDQIEALAAVYGRGGPVTTLMGLGLQRYAGGGQAVRAIDALAAATGQIGIPGGGVNYANRAMTAFFDEEALTCRSQADVREFERGTQAEEILKADPPIRIMFVTRTNPLTQVPDTARLREAYQGIPCKVVVDQFMTPTAEVADYVLPCTNVFEEEDLVFSTMWHSYVTYIHRALPARGEAKPDWQIFAELAEALGFGERMRGTAEEWLERGLRPWRKFGLSLEELRKRGTVRLPIPPIPWSDRRFCTPSGKFEFASDTAEREGHPRYAIYIPPRRIPRSTEGARADCDAGQTGEEASRSAAARRYALLTIHPRLSENSQHKDFPNLPQVPVVEVPRTVAEIEGLGDGDMCELWNDNASLTARVRIMDGGHPYTLKLESGWWGQGLTVNHMTWTARADLGRQTAQYDCWCSIRPVSHNAHHNR